MPRNEEGVEAKPGDIKVTEDESAAQPTSEAQHRVSPHPAGDIEKSQPQTSGPPTHTRQIRGFKWFLACIALFSANFLYGLDSTIAANIQAPVAQTFNDISKLGWLGVGFMLGAVAVNLSLGKAFAVFDTRWVFISCVTMFAAGSALCGGAPTMNAIIVGRVWAGGGGAGMYLGGINYFAVLTSPPETPMYIGFTGLCFGIGLILGPVIGGAFADSSATWRWAFYTNLIIFGAMVPLYLFVLPSIPRRPGTTFVQRLKMIDWLGTLLSAAFYVTFVLFVNFGGNQWAWNDGRTIAHIVVFAITLLAFIVTQAYCVFTTHDDRLFPCEMVLDRALVALYVAMAAVSASFFVVLYYIPLYFQFVYGDNGIRSAVHLLPSVIVYVAVVTFCGNVMPRIGWAIYWYIISGIFLIIGGALMHTVRVSTSVVNIYGYCVLFSLGTLTSQASYAVGPTPVQPQRIPEVLQFLNVAQGQGLLFGLTIASAIFQIKSFDQLVGLLGPMGYSDGDIRSAIAGTKSEVFGMASPDVRAQALDIITYAISEVYVMVIAAGAVYTLVSCLLPYRK